MSEVWNKLPGKVVGSIAVLYVVFKFNEDHDDDDDEEKRIYDDGVKTILMS